MDKSKFTERPGDSEGFEDGARNHAMVCPIKGYPYDLRNGRPGRRVDFETRDAMAVFATRVAQGALDTAVRQLSDQALEECFQAWLDAATLKHNMPSYKDNLRRRIAAMVARNIEMPIEAQITDLTGLQ